MSNFQFLKKEWPTLYAEATEAEKLTFSSPKASAILARSALEKTVNWLYQHDEELELPYNNKLANLLQQQCFRDILKPSMYRQIDLIRRTGNNAAHGHNIVQEQALVTVKYLFRFMSFVGLYYSEEELVLPEFSMQHIPDGQQENTSLEKLQALEKELNATRDKEQAERKRLEEQAKEIELLRRQLEDASHKATQRRQARETEETPEIPELVSEAYTRKQYIDIFLQEAGWENLREGYELEYELHGMPTSTNPSGKGYADYVLWGKDGKPLAVIEAKRTTADARKGRHQATLYADCLERMHGQRPIIFYSNGFENYIWDDTFYADREIYGFYTQDELQLLVDRRHTRKDLRKFSINENIAGRPYQTEAIQRVAENLIRVKNGQLRAGKRDSLLVMATGSGKTRTSAALVDMLTKCNWAKRILFLADRNALVTQAKNAFKEHLPELSAIDLTKEKEDDSTRLVFSTYPSIINRIDAVKTNGKRFYGVGHFDFIIVDEAHRSVYQKYKAIFDYFDAHLIGLTATPKKEIDKNTYGLFGIEDDDPTYAYELQKAVDDNFLVPPKAISVPLKFQREGIKYSELTDDEKREYEEKFGDPSNEEAPEAIGSTALNTWLFNTDTVDKVLEQLMKDGLKVEGGDKLGKTIIFAKNHEHAKFIEKRFNKNYPEYGGHFLRVIDNYEDKAQDLLEKFADEHQEVDPQIAVSVDMMDTGVDAPRVLNLVFFKLVRSLSKFWQMIGRGTRLCPNLFAPNEHKQHFLIFDYCENFEFFDEQPQGYTPRVVKPLLQQIFEGKLQVAQLIGTLSEKSEDEQSIREQYLSDLHAVVSALDRNRFEVQKQLRYQTQYSKAERWQNLDRSQVQEINEHLAHLQTTSKDDDELARRFDILMLNYQVALLAGAANTDKYMRKVYNTAVALQKKDNIPPVKLQLPLIKAVQTEQYWQGINVKKLEELRLAFRDLLKYLESKKQETVYTHFQDELQTEGIVAHEPNLAYGSGLQSYKERVESYIRENKNNITISRLRTNQPITQAELDELEKLLFKGGVAGTKEQFQQEYGEKPLGAFIRSITGMEQEALQEAFADFLRTGNLRADQMTFLNNIISFLTKNGTLDKRMLFEPPFTELNDQGVAGVFDDSAELHKVIGIIDAINGNAGVA